MKRRDVLKIVGGGVAVGAIASASLMATRAKSTVIVGHGRLFLPADMKGGMLLPSDVTQEIIARVSQFRRKT